MHLESPEVCIPNDAGLVLCKCGGRETEDLTRVSCYYPCFLGTKPIWKMCILLHRKKFFSPSLALYLYLIHMDKEV